ncbi:MAG: PaaI family thioesterase [Aliivibrio sp.]|nr:PaaI family thioesterase [Aliivibrio sp.]
MLNEKTTGLELLSGLELMQAMVTGDFPHPSMSEVVPMKITVAEYGKVIFEAMADERHLNPLGGVHGGFFATVMDLVTGCAVHTTLEPNVGYGTIDLHVKMLKAIPQNTLLIAESRVIQSGYSLGISEGSLKDKQGNLYAHATATCMIHRDK